MSIDGLPAGPIGRGRDTCSLTAAARVRAAHGRPHGVDVAAAVGRAPTCPG